MTTMNAQRFKRGMIAIASTAGLGLLAFGASAQSPMDDLNSASVLDLPEQFRVFSEYDPNIRKPTAIVNGEIITRTDVDQRLALVLAANGDVQISEEELQRLRIQVLSNLIDETLQIQEAAANEIEITDAEVEQTLQRVSGNFASEDVNFADYLRQQGSSQRSIERQIEGELAWNRLLRRYVNPRINVSDAEVEAVRERLEASRGQTEYRIAEIYLSARPDNEAQVRANAEQILEQLRRGASFPAYARQYSEASTAAVGGDLGWVLPGQLPTELAQVLPQIPVGAVSPPIPVPGGFSIIAMVDQRQILSADPRNAVLSLKQITVNFPPGTTEADATPVVTQLAEASQSSGGCGAAEALAQSVGGTVVQNDSVQMRDLPPALQQAMVDLQIGQSSPPFGSIEDGVRVLVLCGRESGAPSQSLDPERIMASLQDSRSSRMARNYLRNLRRDAVIEYR
ncbi:MAG: peptidylprolyl isomerase [Parasphingopyxis sp.]|uniref:peptidylprolyl isomerase n=1 Tax=Parasphingopyxis sp. TaxID=1920299 RepID=UPI0032ECCCF1